jgi:hypothetical protein
VRRRSASAGQLLAVVGAEAGLRIRGQGAELVHPEEVAGLADPGAAVEDGPARADRDRRRDQPQQRREHQEDRGRDEDVEDAEDRVDRTGVALRRGRDEFFEACLGLGQLVQEGVAGWVSSRNGEAPTVPRIVSTR